MLRLLGYLIDLVVAILVLRRLSQAFQHLFGAPRVGFWSWGSGSSRRTPLETVQGETARDPVCGMFVSTELSHRLARGNETFHFCSRECLERFQKTNA